ncbi:MAG TPA: GntR family transcriptional regulator [Steroidobacteraceae bacterium]|nr:GntR family transcriptional regulator [Steroidobacteraceae bacterium]
MATVEPTVDVSNRIPRQLLQSSVLERLREEIIAGVWKPAMRLQERLLCERFGISRSPLREALRVLESEGLIELLPNRGAVVSAPTLEDALDHNVLERSLECLAIGLACEHATHAELSRIEALHAKHKRLAGGRDRAAFVQCNNEVHRAIVCASGNRPLMDAHLLNARQLIRIQNLRGFVEHSALESWTEHDAFVRPLLERQRGKAVAALGRHFDTIEDHLRARLERPPEKAGG